MTNKLKLFKDILLNYSEDIIHLGIIFIFPYIAFGSFSFFILISLYVWYQVLLKGFSFYAATYKKRIDDIYQNRNIHLIVLLTIYAFYGIFAYQYSNIVPLYISIPYIIFVSSHDFIISLFIKRIYNLK